MTPSVPSEPMNSRSGAGPAPFAGQATRFHQPLGSDHAERFHKIVNVGIERGVMAAGAGGDPAAQGGKLEGLREMAERQPMGAELLLQGRAVNSGLDVRRPGGLVYFQHLAQVLQVQRDHPGEPFSHVGFDPAHHAGAAPIGNCGHVSFAAPVQERRHLGLVAGKGHEIRRMPELALECTDDVSDTLTQCMAGALFGVGGADFRQRVRRLHPRGAEIQLLDLRRGIEGEFPQAKAGRGLLPQLLLVRRAEVALGHAPAPEFAMLTAHGLPLRVKFPRTPPTAFSAPSPSYRPRNDPARWETPPRSLGSMQQAGLGRQSPFRGAAPWPKTPVARHALHQAAPAARPFATLRARRFFA